MHDLVESHQAIRHAPPRSLVSQNKAALLSGLSRRQISSLVTNGTLATIPCFGRPHVTVSSLEALIRALHRHVTT